ncbi:hypothetical protein LSM04_006681 [Trypanosoma melophagium]|uniref:uncharacterized protein n=1 Tax=Trypanosoma melophagium TaxID=715481 RepID=UPI00351A1071|nr:hypothetical protein LSM04_006681 [Trypanosoma melophagium]
MRRCLLTRTANVLPSTLHNSKSATLSRPFVPVPKVDTGEEAYLQMAHELTLLSSDEFARRLYRFSRTNFDPNHTAAVHAHVSELLRRRMHEMSVKCIREYAHLAHVAKLHDLCLQVYYARANLTIDPSSQDVDEAGGGNFAVSDSVVDSAYNLASSRDLVRLSSYCVKHLQNVTSISWEVMSAFSLVRAFWRCICIAVKNYSTHCTESKQALDDAAYIYNECIALVYPDASRELSTQNIIHTVQRFVKYASCGDEGEMLFFHFCLKKGFLRRPRDMINKNPVDDVSGIMLEAGNSVTNNKITEGGRVSEEQWFYASLIATCRAGQHVHTALRYFDDIGSFLGVEQVSCDDLLRPRSRNVQQEVSVTERQNSRENKINGTSIEKVSEYLIFQLLTVLQAAKDNGKIVFTARAMLRDGAQLSISVWSIVLIAAGETRAVDLAIAAYTQAKDALVESDQSLDRRGNEYLLQTAIHALSKCQVPRFEEEYLRPCLQENLVHCTNEFYFCILLQHAHNSTDPGAGAEDVLQAMKEKGTPLTTRVVSRLMKIYLRIESPKLLELYQHATKRLGLFKPSWLDELLLWADRRRYNITNEERKYILDEVQRVHGVKGAEGDLGGLRTQYALLRYDYEHNPREVFVRTLNPPITEPNITDSRVHFLIKKPHCVLHHYTFHKKNSNPTGQPLLGDPERTQKYLRCAMLSSEGITTAKGSIRTEAFRVYMGQMLQTLQKNNNYVE